MASFFNLTLDTIAPILGSIKLNNGAAYTTNATVALTVSLGTGSETPAQMKIWGIKDKSTENSATWATYSASSSVTLDNTDGLKTVYVKVRDEVGNESSTVSATITLDTTIPVVTVIGPDVSTISKITGFKTATFTFTCDTSFNEWTVRVVPSQSSIHTAGTEIPNTHGSTNMHGNTETEANITISCSIDGEDLETASAGDGAKIIKVFVKDVAGNWSVA